MYNPQKRAAVTSCEEDGGFNRLPDELLLLIFKKIVDLKTLFFSSLVCKRFAPIIPQVDHICLVFPRSKFNPTTSVNPKNNTQNPISSFLDGAARFLTKFVEIRRLDIEIPNDLGANELIKWKAVFGRKIEKLVFFSATSIRQKQQNLDNNKEKKTRCIIVPDRRINVCKTLIMRYYDILLMLVDKYHLLEYQLLDRVTIFDPNKHGMISLSKENLIGIRDSSCSSPRFDQALPEPMKLCCIPVLELRSGFVLEGANLAISGVDACYDDGDFDDGNVIPRELGVGDELFGEAVKYMLSPMLSACCCMEINYRNGYIGLGFDNHPHTALIG